jgi:hypothetical protein
MITVKKSLVKVGAAAAILFGGMGVAAATGVTAAQASTIVVTASPSSGLADGQSTQIAATGLNPGTTYFVNECAYVGTGQLACSQSAVTVTAAADGTAGTPLTVFKTFQAYTGSTVYGTVDCSTTQCLVGVGDASGDGSGVPISFN